MIKDLLAGVFGKGVEKIDAEEVIAKDLKIIDLRNKKDYEEGHIPDSINIPYGEFKTDHPKLAEIDRDEEFCVACIAGISSQKITRLLNEAGYKNAKSLKGGIKSWNHDWVQ